MPVGCVEPLSTPPAGVAPAPGPASQAARAMPSAPQWRCVDQEHGGSREAGLGTAAWVVRSDSRVRLLRGNLVKQTLPPCSIHPALAQSVKNTQPRRQGPSLLLRHSGLTSEPSVLASCRWTQVLPRRPCEMIATFNPITSESTKKLLLGCPSCGRHGDELVSNSGSSCCLCDECGAC